MRLTAAWRSQLPLGLALRRRPFLRKTSLPGMMASKSFSRSWLSLESISNEIKYSCNNGLGREILVQILTYLAFLKVRAANMLRKPKRLWGEKEGETLDPRQQPELKISYQGDAVFRNLQLPLQSCWVYFLENGIGSLR